jgi:hypothetical protein
MAARVEDLLLAAEYLLSAGNEDVVLVERGIRTFETATRNTLDLNAIPYIKQKTHLPVLVDPSHGTGVRDLVIPMSLAAAACGATAAGRGSRETPPPPGRTARSRSTRRVRGADARAAPRGARGRTRAGVTPVRPRAGLRGGEALALHRRLPTDPDPLALYAALSDGGGRPDTFLLERTVGPSLLMDEAALRVECRGCVVTLDALTPNGAQALAAVAMRLPERVVASEDQQLVLRFERLDSMTPRHGCARLRRWTCSAS